MKKWIYTNLILLSLSAHAFDPAPRNEILCTADIFQGLPTNPIDGMQAFSFVLPSDTLSLTWSRQIEKLEVQEKYQKFFSAFWIAPDHIFPFPLKAVLSHTPIASADISFTLSRFPQSEKRVAGMSLEYNVARGFYAAYLLDPENDGPNKKVQAPVKFDDGPGILAVDCHIR